MSKELTKAVIGEIRSGLWDRLPEAVKDLPPVILEDQPPLNDERFALVGESKRPSGEAFDWVEWYHKLESIKPCNPPSGWVQRQIFVYDLEEGKKLKMWSWTK